MAADIASKLCESVADKLDGKVIGTFTGEYLAMMVCIIAVAVLM